METYMERFFLRISEKISDWMGTSWAFIFACIIIVTWAVSGPLFHFSSTWQLVINTGTTIITFLMVFLIQNTQNITDAAVQLKLDELIRATDAHNDLLNVEKLGIKDLKKLAQIYQSMSESPDQEVPAINQDKQ